MFFEVIGADRFVDRGAAVQVVDDEPAEFLLLLGDDADAALFVVVKDEMVQNDAVKIRAEDAQDYCLRIIDQRCRQRHAHAGQRHGLAELDAQVFVQDLRHDIQPAGRRVAIKEDAEANTHHQNVAQHVERLAARQRREIREQPLKKPQKHRQHHARIDGLRSEFPPAGEKADQQQDDVQNHRDRRQRQRHEI